MPKSKYIAQNRISGLAKKDLVAGDSVELEEDAAAPFVKTGSLKLSEAADPPKDPPKEPPAK